ncbi:MAG: hypothetical protein IJS47_00275 [Clostridia bacterium]|nr:hypothetical protein [Clostridia bacterium]
MDLKRVKLMLIFLFLIINIFLMYMLYKENIKSYADTITAIKNVLAVNNVEVIPNLNIIDRSIKMQKLNIVDNTGITEDLLITEVEVEGYELIGKKRKIVSVATLLANFIRDNAPHDITIKAISRGYFYDSTKVSENLLTAEAEPCWIIETNEKTYYYNAYGGELIKIEE